MLVAARSGEEWVLVNHLDELLVIADRRFPLSATAYFDAGTQDRLAIHPKGHEALKEFRAEPFPEWRFEHEGIALVRRAKSVRRRAGILIEYAIEHAAVGAHVEIRPMISGRKATDLHAENRAIKAEAAPGWRHVKLEPYGGVPPIALGFSERDAWRSEPVWYRRVRLAGDARDEESVLSPGVIRLPIAPDSPAWLWLATDEPPATLESAALGLALCAETISGERLLPLMTPLAAEIPSAPLDVRLWWTITLATAFRRGVDGRTLAPDALAMIDALWRGDAADARVDESGLLDVRATGSSWWERRDPERRPRVGQPIEIESLWLNALAAAEIIARVLNRPDEVESSSCGYAPAFLRASESLKRLVRATPPEIEKDGSAILMASALRHEILPRSKARTLFGSFAKGGVRLFPDRGASYDGLAILRDHAARTLGISLSASAPEGGDTLPELSGLMLSGFPEDANGV